VIRYSENAQHFEI